jgi:hypothetical protein
MTATSKNDQTKAFSLAAELVTKFDTGDLYHLNQEHIPLEERDRLRAAVDPDYQQLDASRQDAYDRLEKIVGKKHRMLLTGLDDNETELRRIDMMVEFHLGWAMALRFLGADRSTPQKGESHV